MAKIDRKKTLTLRRNWLIYAGCLIVIVAVTLLVLEKTGVINMSSPNSSAANNQPSAEELKQQTEASNSAKDKFLNATPTPSITPTLKQPEVSARQESNGDVTVLTKIYDSTASQCQLSMTNGASVVNKQAQVIYQSDYSICAGFSINKSELTNGIWQIALTVVGSDGTGYTAANIEVK